MYSRRASTCKFSKKRNSSFTGIWQRGLTVGSPPTLDLRFFKWQLLELLSALDEWGA